MKSVPGTSWERKLERWRCFFSQKVKRIWDVGRTGRDTRSRQSRPAALAPQVGVAGGPYKHAVDYCTVKSLWKKRKKIFRVLGVGSAAGKTCKKWRLASTRLPQSGLLYRPEPPAAARQTRMFQRSLGERAVPYLNFKWRSRGSKRPRESDGPMQKERGAGPKFRFTAPGWFHWVVAGGAATLRKPPLCTMERSMVRGWPKSRRFSLYLPCSARRSCEGKKDFSRPGREDKKY